MGPIEEAAAIVDKVRANIGMTVSPGCKLGARVRLRLQTEEKHTGCVRTKEEINRCFYSEYEEEMFVRERELVAHRFPIEKRNGLFVDEAVSYSVRGLEDRVLSLPKRHRRAKHTSKVLSALVVSRDENNQESDVYQQARQVSYQSSQADCKRALEVAQQDDLVAMEICVESIIELGKLDRSTVDLLKGRLTTTRIDLAKANVNGAAF